MSKPNPADFPAVISVTYQKWLSSAIMGCLFLFTQVVCAHELWIETGPQNRSDQTQAVRIFWGHGGNKETGKKLEDQTHKLTARVHSVEGPEVLDFSLIDDGFQVKPNFAASGIRGFSADLQVGIIDRQNFSTPANTRIVMHAKTVSFDSVSDMRHSLPFGLDFELVPVSLKQQPKIGDLLTLQVYHLGKPIDQPDVRVSAVLLNKKEGLQDSQVKEWERSAQAAIDTLTGKVNFSLALPGIHLFRTRYFDETPGVYVGPRNDVSDFSHLRKGDKYERTLHIATLTVDISE